MDSDSISKEIDTKNIVAMAPCGRLADMDSACNFSKEIFFNATLDSINSKSKKSNKIYKFRRRS